MDKETRQPDNIELTALTAHQLQSPLAAVKHLLEMLLGDYVGPVSGRQKELLARAAERCDQGVETVRRMLAIARAQQETAGEEAATDLVAVLHKIQSQYAHQAQARNIKLTVDIDARATWASCQEAAITEALNAVVNNALKYTPDHGQVRLALGNEPDEKHLLISVADSGTGIPVEARKKVFEHFYRTVDQRNSTRPGTGLGLAFVRAIVIAAGGSIRAEASDLGGAEILITLPIAKSAGEASGSDESRGMKVVIVGGVAAGPKVASKVIRLMPDAEVTIVERGTTLSYAGCGLPYYVSGVVKKQSELMSTPVGAVRDHVFFQNVKNVRVMNQTEALSIDRQAKQLLVQDLVGRGRVTLDYDKLVLATGSMPIRPNIPGCDLDNIFTLHGVYDAEGIKSMLAEPKSHDVVIIGGGLIGVEVTEALARRGCRVTIIEKQDKILPMLDWEMAKLVEQHLEACGVKVLTGTEAVRFEGSGQVTGVVTPEATLPAEMVILAIGVTPAAELAKSAGLKIGKTGAIKTDPHMRTSDPDIYAAGDCVEHVNLITGNACYFPLGSTANKQGRVAAVNIAGGNDTFPGVLGSTICKAFDYCVGKTGLGEAVARKLGYDVTTVLAPAPDREHFMPNAKYLLLKLVVDTKTRKLLGAQVTGPGEGHKRIDGVALAITAGMTVDQLANADLSYAPSYSLTMDNIITAANVARNKLDGLLASVTPMEVRQMQRDKRDFVFLDVRSPGEYAHTRLGGATLIPLAALRSRLRELPPEKEIVTFCQISLRGYEAALILNHAGFKNVRVMDGGVEMWPFEKLY